MKRYGMGAFLSFLLVCVLSEPLAVTAAEPPGDEVVSFRVREALREDPRVEDSKLKVTTQSGIVTLAGQVPDLASKEFADLEAKKIAGVRGVINKLLVFVIPRSDTDITRDLLKAFLNSADIELRDIGVNVKEGHVTLSGHVDSWAQRDEAELISKELRGVKSVTDTIQVTIRQKRSDEDIRRDIIGTLERDVYLTDTQLGVMVEKGIATLTGEVATPYQKDRAVEDALFVVNVRDVRNSIEIIPWQDQGARKKPPLPSDRELEKNIRNELYQDLRIADPFEIHVEALGGHVLLRGTVRSHYQKRLAAHDAQDVVGVVWVTNLLSVGTERREDQALRDDVRSSLESDSVLNGMGIHVRVKDGVVTMTGNVNIPYEKEHALDVASRVFGVRDVINHIQVDRFPKYRDASLKKRIRERLSSNWETRRAVDRIAVYVKDGVVVLTGDVDTWSEYKEAARIASLTDGVWEVVNHLKVAGADYPWIEY